MEGRKDKLKDFFESLDVHLPKDRILKDSNNIESFSTGSPGLDEVIGVGGYPKGKIIEFFGVDSSGKTTLALHALSQIQKLKKVAVYIDLENTINFSWARKIGVDVENFYIARPKNGEAVFELIRNLVTSNKVDLIVVDSVSSLVPSCELDNSIEDQHMGQHARLMSRGLRIIQSCMISSITTIIFINQVREKMGGLPFMPSITTTGGRALKYAASVRIEIKRCEKIQDSSGKILGFETKFIVAKNKYSAPMSISKTAIYFDSGIDVYHEVIQRLIDKKVLVKKGSWLEFEGKNIAQGIIQLRNKLMAEPELYEKFKKLSFPNFA